MTRKRRPARKTKTGGRPDRIAEITLYMTHGPDSLWERSIDRFRDAMADERNGPDPNAFLAVSGWPQARTKELFGTILYKMGQNRDRVPPSADNRRLFPIHTPSEGPAPGMRSGGANIDLLISPKVRPGEAKAIWAWLLDCVVAAVMDTRLAPAIIVKGNDGVAEKKVREAGLQTRLTS